MCQADSHIIHISCLFPNFSFWCYEITNLIFFISLWLRHSRLDWVGTLFFILTNTIVIFKEDFLWQRERLEWRVGDIGWSRVFMKSHSICSVFKNIFNSIENDRWQRRVSERVFLWRKHWKSRCPRWSRILRVTCFHLETEMKRESRKSGGNLCSFCINREKQFVICWDYSAEASALKCMLKDKGDVDTLCWVVSAPGTWQLENNMDPYIKSHIF